jgi:serine/threonine protein kinase
LIAWGCRKAALRIFGYHRQVMPPQCPACGRDVLDIDVKCGNCGAALGASGAHRMLGQMMLGQYELVDVLGQGGMSVVFKGKHKMTEQEVALKILPPELAAHSQVKSRFLEEAKALAALDHANIVHLYNFGEQNGSFVLAMQYVEGRTWERLILENKRLDWRTSCRICSDVLRALEYAHGRGVVHRDMKPSNVLVRKHDGSATVMDFGIAKMTTSTRLTATGQTMGTVRYMSPEQVRGQEVDLKTDIYSLGATLYESLTGDTPFDGTTHFEIMTKHLSEPPKRPSSLGVEVPAAVEDALMRALAKRADDRWESARDMRKVLDTALREVDIGLVETQRVSRDLLGDIVRTPASLEPVARIATASDLADQLEPSPPPLRPRRKKSLAPWLVLALLVVAGGAAVAVIAFGRHGDARMTPAGPFPELELRAPKTVGTLAIVTDGTVTPDQVSTAFETELARVQQQIDDALAAKGKPPRKLPVRIHELYAVPQSALCMKSAYVLAPPDDCGSAAFAIVVGDQSEAGKNATEPRLYLVAARLPEAIKGGVEQAACDAVYDGSKESVEICEVATGRLGKRRK